MKTHLIKTPIKDLAVVKIDFFVDERGFFIESWHQKDFKKAGLDLKFVQEGHSKSKKGVLRGLHFQNRKSPMSKLIRCTSGRIYDVAVDLRISSPTFGKWFGIELNDKNMLQLFVPVGFAHGFATLSASAEVQYKQGGFYDPQNEGSIVWNDPDIGILWSVKNPILSKKDKVAQSLKDYLKNPVFE